MTMTTVKAEEGQVPDYSEEQIYHNKIMIVKSFPFMIESILEQIG